MNDSYNYAMRNPILTAQTSMNNPNATTRLTLEQQYANLSNQMLQNQSQPQQSNPYTDYLDVLNSLSASEREMLFQTQEHAIAYAQCEELLKAEVYKSVIGTVLQTKAGVISFETLYGVTKKFQDDRINKNIQKERQLELLMQDEVVLRRLQELQNIPQNTSQNAPQPPSTPVPTQSPLPQPSQNASAQSNQQTHQKQNSFKNKQSQKPQSGGNNE